MRADSFPAGICDCDAHSAPDVIAGNQPGRRKSLRESCRPASRFTSVRSHAQNAAWVLSEIDFERWVEFEESSHERRPDVIESALERVPPNRFGNVILELV